MKTAERATNPFPRTLHAECGDPAGRPRHAHPARWNPRADRQGGRGVRRCTALLSALAAAGALVGCGGDTLAEADGARLEVEEAAALIAEHAPATLNVDEEVVRIVAELWVDYTLLSERLAEDSTLATLDVEIVADRPLQEIVLGRLREEVLEVDTVVSESELADRFALELPGARATASQILLPFPRSASNRQRDSVLTVAEDLRAELFAGADFTTLAVRHSGDPGSARAGGSMGTFGRGQMLAPLDSAIFTLRPGQLSEPVATPLGYHILRLDEVMIPELSEIGDSFRALIQRERLAAAEAAHIAELDSLAALALAPGALEIVRALTRSSPARLTGRAAERPLLTWREGVYTAGDFVELARVAPDGFGGGILDASDSELEVALRRLGQQELLLAEAAARGLEPTAAEIDSVAAAARSAILERARAIGLAGEANRDSAGFGAASPETAGERVRALLSTIVSGREEIVPLAGITFLLREGGRWHIHEQRIGRTVERVRALRGES